MKTHKEELVLSLVFLKAQKNKKNLALSKASTPKSILKIREEIDSIRRTFFDLIYDHYDLISTLVERITDENKNAFNIMAPIGGGYYIRKEASLHCYRCAGGRIEVVFDSYIGYLNFWEDPCGIDNLKILTNQMHEVAA